MADHELDVRQTRKPDKHPAIFRAFAELPAGDALVLVNDHDPRHLRDEFEVEYPRGYGWEYLAKEPREWRIRISKLATTPLPRVLTDAAAIAGARPAGQADDASQDGEADPAGIVWKLQMRERDLDSNIVSLAPGGQIGAHAGPDVDVLVCVLAGSGELITELDALSLAPGALVWLPRRSRRQFDAGPGGLRYLTVHQRRQALTRTTAPDRS
jgi:uncharacterized protein (DUF2249 family)/quercetin dioxygenase-like cupin family protein